MSNTMPKYYLSDWKVDTNQPALLLVPAAATQGIKPCYGESRQINLQQEFSPRLTSHLLIESQTLVI